MDGAMRTGVGGWLGEARELGECGARASRMPVEHSRARSQRDGGNGAIECAGVPERPPRHPVMRLHEGGGDIDRVVAEAYCHVVDGYRRALRVSGLPREELEDLRVCLRAASQIARLPALDLARSPCVGPPISQQAG